MADKLSIKELKDEVIFGGKWITQDRVCSGLLLNLLKAQLSIFPSSTPNSHKGTGRSEWRTNTFTTSEMHARTRPPANECQRLQSPSQTQRPQDPTDTTRADGAATHTNRPRMADAERYRVGGRRAQRLDAAPISLERLPGYGNAPNLH